MGVKIIAEVGCNHKGDMEIAKELIRVAAVYAKADVVKFQKRNNRELLTEEQYNAPHPNPANSYGDTYGDTCSDAYGDTYGDTYGKTYAEISMATAKQISMSVPR